VTPAVLLPVLLAAGLGLGAGRIGRALPPATAVRVLTAAAFAASACTGLALSTTAVLCLARVPELARLGPWSARAVTAPFQLPPAAGGGLALLVALLVTAGLRHLGRSLGGLLTAARTCRRLRPAGPLVILTDDAPEALALPGAPGRVVVSTGMLRALSAPERRALLAHERAHLQHVHHLYAQVAELAAAACPLVRPVAREVRYGIERWADEAAAAETGDRLLVARTVARAGMARTGRAVRRPDVALRAGDRQVLARARALVADPPRRRPLLAGALCALTLLTVLAGGVLAVGTDLRLDVAEVAYTGVG
jgi:Zn-dependent protease with chaperone function